MIKLEKRRNFESVLDIKLYSRFVGAIYRVSYIGRDRCYSSFGKISKNLQYI